MFSKGKAPSETGAAPSGAQHKGEAAPLPSSPPPTPAQLSQSAKPKPSPSLLSSDITIKGNISTSGDIQIEGTIEGDVRAHLLTVGENATIRGEVIADDVVVNGHVIGRLRGLKVRLTATAQVEGDIVHKSIAIESGAHFEGSVQRREDPFADTQPAPRKAIAGPVAGAQSEETEKAQAG